MITCLLWKQAKPQSHYEAQEHGEEALGEAEIGDDGGKDMLLMMSPAKQRP